jgi:ATP-dependent helicase HrpA/adenine-specific DNA-methyltransferase
MKPIRTAWRLRRASTDAEQKLWSRLRNRQLRGLKFRRQVPIGPYVADFACIEARIVIEVDGGQHLAVAEADKLRSQEIEAAGYIVVRFWNDEVLANIDAVMAELDGVVTARTSSYPQPP